MDLLKSGKTKNAYRRPDGNILLAFKDDATGAEGVFDPGANQVIGTIPGKAKAGVRLSEFFFKKMEEAGIPTHFISADAENATMVVKPAELFGEGLSEEPGAGLEVICRIFADGSYIRRYGKYAKKGESLDYLVEVTLKDDDRGDPEAGEEKLLKMGLLIPGEYRVLRDLVQQATKIIEFELAKKGLVLWDIKLEFGRDENKGIILIDEISTDCWRVRDAAGNSIEPADLVAKFFGA